MAEMPLHSLRPIQAYGGSKERLEDMARAIDLPPVEVVPYEEKDGTVTSYLLVDGTHRAYLRHQRGLEGISARVLETDEHIIRTHTVALTGCKSLLDVRKRYEERWKPCLDREGVDSIAALAVRTVVYPGIKYW